MSGAPKYQANIDRKNKNDSHTLALDFIEANHEGQNLRILEVGCSTGYFGAALKSMGHVVCGVEMDEVSSKIAKGYLDEVHCCTIQEYFERNPDQMFDAITFGDVLEHLVDPEAVLEATRKHLNPEGRLIVSIPNVAHASIRCMMLQGDWTYSELGILDRTHLRFFTKKSLIEMFDKSGFSITHMQGIKASALNVASICGLSLDPGILRHVESIKNDDTLEDFQYVICAQPNGEISGPPRQIATRKRALRILATCADSGSYAAHLRLGAPLQGFANEGCRSLRFGNFGAITPMDIEWSDIVIIHCGSDQHADAICEMARQAGKPVVYDIDGLLTELPGFSENYQEVDKSKAIIESLIRRATLVTVTTQNLLNALSHLNKSSVICQNYLSGPSGVTQSPHDPSADAEINLIIESSDNLNIEVLWPALVAIRKKYKNRVFIQAFGPVAEVLKSHGVECNSLDISQREVFISTIGDYQNSIGIIPADDSIFGICSSPTKYFAYSQAGLVSICSNDSPYKDVIDNGSTGILCDNNTNDWVDKLTRLIEEPEFRRRVALNAQSHVREHHNLQKTIDAWTAIFQQLAPGDVVIQQPLPPPPPPPNLSLLEKIVNFLKKKNRQRKARRAQRRQQKREAAALAVH